MKRFLAAVVLVLAVVGLAHPAQADWRRHDGWDNRWSDGGRWHDDSPWNRPRHYPRPPRQMIMVYPSPPVVYARPNPRVVFMDPTPMQAVPTSPPYTDGYGRFCREYQSTLVVGGAAQSGYGTACLQPDGSWRVVN